MAYKPYEPYQRRRPQKTKQVGTNGQTHRQKPSDTRRKIRDMELRQRKKGAMSTEQDTFHPREPEVDVVYETFVADFVELRTGIVNDMYDAERGEVIASFDASPNPNLIIEV